MKAKFAAALGLVVLVSTSGCLDLEENVVTGVTADYYETSQGLDDAVRAAYSYLQEHYASERAMTLHVMGTDTWTKGSDGGFKYFNDYTPQLNPTSGIVSEVWGATYQAINDINAVLGRAENIQPTPNFTEATKTTRLAEARFLRGLFYFNLVRLFGDVHLTLEETTGVVTEATRTPAAEVYNQILDDLAFAEANLPIEQDEYGRATKGAAQHLLGLVYLTRSYRDYAQPDDAERAAGLFRSVIDSGQYELLPDFSDIFRVDNERNREVIFSVQFTNDPLTTGSGNRWHLFFLMEYDREPGLQRVVEYGRPWKRVRPTEYLIDAWDRDIDARYEKSFQFVWYAVNPDPSRGLEVGDTALFFPSVKTSELPDEFKNKNYRIFTEPESFWSPTTTPYGAEYDYRYYPTLIKHLDPTRSSANEVRAQRDFIVMRLADTYLLLAEAYLETGQLAEAAEAINEVRLRAAKPGEEAAMMITPDQVTLNFILDERARELAGEGHRWYTLTRTNTLLDRVILYNQEAALNIQPFHVLRPIPQAQIDRTAGDFPQNPGY